MELVENSPFASSITCKLMRGKPLYFCNVCSNFFEKLPIAEQHVQNGHQNPPPTSAPKEKTLIIVRAKDHLKNPKRPTKLKNKAVKCQPHKIETPRPPAVSKSNKKVAAKESFKCAMCDRRYNLMINLKKHIQSTHQSKSQGRKAQNSNRAKPAQSVSSTSTSTTKKNLVKVNMENGRAHVTNGPYSTTCNFCKQEFKFLSQALRHVRNHTGEKSFRCSHCLREFSQKANMVRHGRIHTGDRPYQCPICSVTFSDQSNMKYHIAARHPNSTFNSPSRHNKQTAGQSRRS